MFIWDWDWGGGDWLGVGMGVRGGCMWGYGCVWGGEGEGGMFGFVSVKGVYVGL